jgi:hypothetical protein
MDATTVATAGVQPGDTSKVRALADRISKLQQLVIVNRLLRPLEAAHRRGELTDLRPLQQHLAVRNGLARELGLL